MNVEGWIILAVSAVVIPSVAWLVKAVLDLKERMIRTEAWIALKADECQRHQQWAGTMQSDIKRIDKNISRLCQAAGVQESD